jgi:aminoglycoside phosphotransferase family enzyme/predicted kinase
MAPDKTPRDQTPQDQTPQDQTPQDLTSQDPVFAFLADPATHGGATVTRIDTHAASIFLSGDRALKIKRAVKFPFLDYTTLDKRKAACEAELDVNRLYAPAIYRGVRAITRAPDGTLSIDGLSTGETVEYAVEMSRFDESKTLDHLADKSEIDAALADKLGRAVAKAHAIVPVVRDAGFAATLDDVIRQNHDELRAASDLFATAEVDALTASTRAAYERVSPLLAARARDRFVRRCHGDLHLGNIVLIDGVPTLFDAIEFNPVFATIDTFYDLAFLLMDLIERKLRQPANIVLNRYLTETDTDANLDALAALPLFMSVRAAIRAKVAAARPQRDAAIAKAARDYFDLAQSFLQPPEPMLIAIGGLSGTGKSVLARALAAGIGAPPGAVLLRSDVIRKTMFDVAETERLPASAYTPDVTAEVYARLADKARRVIATGHSAIVDAVFAKPHERTAIAEAALGKRFNGLFLTADLAARLARVVSRTNDASDANAVIARGQEAYDLGSLDGWHEVDASGTPEETLERSKAAIGA